MTATFTTAIPDTAARSAVATVTRIADLSTFSALREDWNGLLRVSDSDCLFLTWEWLYTWWKHLAGDRQLSILIVRAGGQLVGLAPFGLRRPSLWNHRLLPVLEFLGSGFVGSDYLDVIARKGCEKQVREALAHFLSRERAVLDLTNLRRGNSFASVVASELAGRQWHVSEKATNVCPFISVSGLSWEMYLATLGSEHRYNFNRKWKRLNRDYRVDFEAVAAPGQCREAVDLTIHLHNLRWRERGRSDAFHTDGLVGFHREFCALALEHGWLRLFVLRLNGAPAASLYGFRYGKTFYFYQSGFDPAYQKHSVGLVSMGLGIRSAIEEGVGEYDLLHGNEEYKSHWSRESRELARVESYPPGVLGSLCQTSVNVERASRRMARKVITRVSG